MFLNPSVDQLRLHEVMRMRYDGREGDGRPKRTHSYEAVTAHRVVIGIFRGFHERTKAPVETVSGHLRHVVHGYPLAANIGTPHG
jgi:hypothetical protein